MSYQKLTAIGNLGADVELNYTSSGVPVAHFSIATTERWIDKVTGEKKEHTEWLRCVAWRNQAENCAKFLHKGSKVFIEARVRNSSYTDTEGVKRYSTEYNVDYIEFLDSKGNGDSAIKVDRYSTFVKVAESVLKLNPKATLDILIQKVTDQSSDLKANFNSNLFLDTAKKIASKNKKLDLMTVSKSALKYMQDNELKTPADLEADEQFVPPAEEN